MTKRFSAFHAQIFFCLVVSIGNTASAFASLSDFHRLGVMSACQFNAIFSHLKQCLAIGSLLKSFEADFPELSEIAKFAANLLNC